MTPRRNRFLADFFMSIANRGRALLGYDALERKPEVERLLTQCKALISWQGEATGLAIAHNIFTDYARLEKERRIEFLCLLGEQFGTDIDRFERALADWQTDPSPENATQVHFASEPQRQELLRRLNRVPNGTATLVEMRGLLLEALKVHSGLKSTNRDFLHLFSSWFNRGFLELRRIDWSTPAAILDKIIQYEAVHEIKDWEDLRRRIDPPDRRCYAFFHPSLEDEPLIFVEIALVKELPMSITEILADDRESIALERTNTAVFYSISNCQAGLRGVSFGNFLIKQVVNEIVTDLPHVTNFITLSPIWRFVQWLEDIRDNSPELLQKDKGFGALAHLANPNWHMDEKQRKALEPLLMSLATQFLTQAKNTYDKPLDPVARFHLGNGARLEGLNWLANMSEEGLQASYGIMANYRYVLKHIEQNHEAFAESGSVATSNRVQRLLKYPLAKSDE